MTDRMGTLRRIDALADEDSTARERALDITQSFLVQAPAGSGKTELLIQRFLALLPRVDRPERIVAVTFTRKAAGEMRERVVAALREAKEDTRVDTPHGQRTRALALAALAQDERRDWQLATHPSRLQVQTIDALSASIARQAPLATRLGAVPRCEEQADWLYMQAARDALMSASRDDAAWRLLLAHLDNDADAAVALLSSMLAKRDQWLGKLQGGAPASMRAALEAVLATEIEGELKSLRSAFPPALAQRLVEYERYAASNLTDEPRSASFAQVLRASADAGGLPPATVSHLDEWRTFAAWLMRSDGSAFVKLMNAAKGFPPKAQGPGAAQRHVINCAMNDLLQQLAAVPDLAAALHSARELPPPRYPDEAWAVVNALLTVLPQAAAHLTLAFRANSAIDFIESAMAALDALGTSESPSDLLLRVDYAVHHLLVDEFQDTSLTQLELIRRLTAGWQRDDGRTLFAVGDPMQSIYRFREAEVRLFIEAQQQQRIGDIAVECLTLRRNFRSRAGLVDWVNSVFPAVLGARNDPWRSVVAFAEATAADTSQRGPLTTIEIPRDDKAEGAVVVAHVRASLKAGVAKTAVLVRARAHLDRILPALRAASIPFEAIDLDILGQRQAVQDLTSLTHALAQPADRLAWLAVLRAPWCGLALPDLFAVAAAADQHAQKSIAAVVCGEAVIPGLSDEGGERLVRVAQVIGPALASRGRSTLSGRVRGAWLALGGPACIDQEIDLAAAESFFALLAQHEVAGDIANWSAFIAALGILHAEPRIDAASRVLVMTLHRAKGLEFDTVIMPALARRAAYGNVELLRWRLREQGLLLAPMTARGADKDRLYAYLTSLAEAEEDAELGRLLYVGCTRARQRLYLTAVLEPEQDESGGRRWKTPISDSALMKLWPALEHSIAPPHVDTQQMSFDLSPPLMLSRLPLAWKASASRADVSLPPASEAVVDEQPVVFDWAREMARHIGTVAHRAFAQIAADGIDAWDELRVAAARPRIAHALRGEGIEDAALDDATAEVEAALRKIISDERGRWLFAPSHADARSEWSLAGVDGDSIVHIVIDRTFVADGVRWIVDFKTGRHEGADVDAFLDRERTRYEPQLARYARIMRALDDRPIRLGLYYPMQGEWREWSHDG